VLGARAGALQRPPDRVTDGLDLDDILFYYGIRRQRLHCIVLDAIARAGLAQLQQLHRGRTDVDADQGRSIGCQ
jgi:DNA polymerase III epsilon subunit-like protein